MAKKAKKDWRNNLKPGDMVAFCYRKEEAPGDINVMSYGIVAKWTKGLRREVDENHEPGENGCHPKAKYRVANYDEWLIPVMWHFEAESPITDPEYHTIMDKAFLAARDRERLYAKLTPKQWKRLRDAGFPQSMVVCEHLRLRGKEDSALINEDIMRFFHRPARKAV